MLVKVQLNLSLASVANDTEVARHSVAYSARSNVQ